MDRDPDVIRANVERYRQMLRQPGSQMDPNVRETVEKLLAEELAKTPRQRNAQLKR